MTALLATATTAATLVLAAPAQAAVTLRDDGTGFVGPGEVKAALDWNGRELRANAGTVRFVVASQSVTRRSWTCVNTRTGKVRKQSMTVTVDQSRSVAHEVRTGRKGFVTGFRLTGFDGYAISAATVDGRAPGTCPAGPWSPVPRSTRTAGHAAEPVVRVVHGGTEHDLPAPDRDRGRH